MNVEALKKALIRGIPNGIVTWLIYGLVFKMLIDKKPFKAAMFDRDSIIFLVIVTVVEVILYYVGLAKRPRSSRNARIVNAANERRYRYEETGCRAACAVAPAPVPARVGRERAQGL